MNVVSRVNRFIATNRLEMFVAVSHRNYWDPVEIIVIGYDSDLFEKKIKRFFGNQYSRLNNRFYIYQG